MMMLNFKSILMLLTILFVLTTAKDASRIQDPKSSIIDSVLRGLESDTWSDEEIPCLHATTEILNGVKNQTLWAMWIWNSMQIPVGTFYGSKFNLGNFDQCLQAPWSSSHPGLQTQYCLVDVKMADLRKYEEDATDPQSNAEKYISMKSFHGRHYNSLVLGVCLPSSCKPSTIAKISRHIHSLSDLPFEDAAVDPEDCQVAGQTLERAPEFYLFWCIILIMVSVCLVVYVKGSPQDDSTVSKVLRCFCLTRNFDALTKPQEDDIPVLHGMRAITGSLLIVIHLYFFMGVVGIVNDMHAIKGFTSKYGRLMLHLDTLVDTFFFMSGLLHARGLISNKSSKPLKVLWKRYLRLTVPTYALTVMCYAYVLPHIGSGPTWPRFISRAYKPCVKSTWKNFIMLGNKADETEYCIDVSWYIHCDYQLTVLGTALVMAYQWRKKEGSMIFLLTYILSFIIPTILSYSNQFPGITWYNFGEALVSSQNRLFGTIYIQSYNRASPYVIGMALGCLMTVYRPQDYRRIIPKASSIIGFIVGSSLMLLVLQIGSKTFNREYGPLTTALYASLDRSIWTVGILLIVVVCEYGTLPIINGLLSSKVMLPFSKLAYANYMCHTLFLYRSLFSLRSPLSFDAFDWIIKGLGYVVISYFFSFTFWLFIEGPAMNLTSLVTGNKTTKTVQPDAIKVAKETNTVKIEKTL